MASLGLLATVAAPEEAKIAVDVHCLTLCVRQVDELLALETRDFNLENPEKSSIFIVEAIWRQGGWWIVRQLAPAASRTAPAGCLRLKGQIHEKLIGDVGQGIKLRLRLEPGSSLTTEMRQLASLRGQIEVVRLHELLEPL